MLEVKSFKGGFDDNFSYLLFDDVSKKAAIIDTALDPAILFEFANHKNLAIKFAIIMHSHADHTVALDVYRQQDIPLFGHRTLPFDVQRELEDGDIISLAGYGFEILHAPGHTPDAICLYGDGRLFTTDVLFIDGCGRCDLPGGNALQMYHTLQKLQELPDETMIYPGHDYGKVSTDTLGNQKKTNKYLLTESEEEFVKMRQ